VGFGTHHVLFCSVKKWELSAQRFNLTAMDGLAAV
jgi:hypothetical protein